MAYTIPRIEFRMWDGEKMHEPGGFIDAGSAAMVVVLTLDGKVDVRSLYGFDSGPMGVKPEVILLPFTGQLDKNGNKIFLHHICKDSDGKRVVVGWDNQMASFTLQREEWMFKHWFGESYRGDQLEIIGDIYQNPDLLV